MTSKEETTTATTFTTTATTTNSTTTAAMGYQVLIGIYTTIIILFILLCLVPWLLRKYMRAVTRQEWQLDVDQTGEFSTITTSTRLSSTTSTLQHNNLDIHELLNIKFKFQSTRSHGRKRQSKDRGQNPSSANPTTPTSHSPETPHIYTKGENDSTDSGVSNEDCLVDPEGIRQQKVAPVLESSFPITPSSHSPEAPLANTQRRGNDRKSFIMHPTIHPVGQKGMEEVVQCFSPSNGATCQNTTYPVFSCFNGPAPPQINFNCKCTCEKWYPGSHSEVNAFVASEISQSFPALKVTGKYTPSVSTCFEGSSSPQTKMHCCEGHKMYPESCIALPQSHEERETLPKSVSHEGLSPSGETYPASSSLHTCFESLPPSQTKTNHTKPHKMYPGSWLVLPQIPHDAAPKATSHEQFPPLRHHRSAPGSNPAPLDASFKESGISSGLWGVCKERQRSSCVHPNVSQDEINNIYDVPPSRILPVAALCHALQCEAGREGGGAGGEEEKGGGGGEEEEKGERGNV